MSAQVLVLAAAKSEVPFYIAGGVLAMWAVIAAGFGIRRPGFPAGRIGQAGVIAVSAILVAATAATGVITAHSPERAAAATASTTTSAAPAPAVTGGGGTISDAAAPSGALAFTKSALRVAPGRVTINFANAAPEMHNLTVASGAKVLGATPTFQGGSHSITLNLKPGTYQFYCSVPGHRAAGMHGTLVVG